MPDPKPVRPRVKDAKAYERALRTSYLDPLLADLRRRLAQATSVTEAYRLLQAGMAAFDAVDKTEVVAHEAATALNRVQANHKARLFRAFRRAIGVDVRPFLQDGTVRPFMLDRLKENVELIKSLPPRTHASLQRRLGQEFAEAPFDQARLNRLLRDEFKSTRNRAKVITRDQTNKLVGQLNQVRNQQLRIESYVWGTSEDERVRPTHAANNGLEFRWDTPPAATGHPGFDIQCFPGSVSILPLGLQRTIAYRYIGQLVQIHLANGINITTTSNHPILTETGWKGAGIVDEGDKLFVHGGIGFLTSGLLNPDVKNGHPRTEQLHCLAGGVRDLSRAHGRSVDLHGDVARWNKEVEIVNIKGVLRDKFNSDAFQMFVDFALEFPDMDFIESCLPTLGSFPQAFSLPSSVASLFIGGAGKGTPAFKRQSRHTNFVGFRTRPRSQSQFRQAEIDSGTWYSQLLGHFEYRLSQIIASLNVGIEQSALFASDAIGSGILDSQIPKTGLDYFGRNPKFPRNSGISNTVFNSTLDDWQHRLSPFAPVSIRGITLRHHDGPVYSMETDTGLIIANGIVTHNCRCVGQPIVTPVDRQRLKSSGRPA